MYLLQTHGSYHKHNQVQAHENKMVSNCSIEVSTQSALGGAKYFNNARTIASISHHLHSTGISSRTVARMSPIGGLCVCVWGLYLRAGEA